MLFFLIQCAPLECVFTRMENSCVGTLSRWPPSAFTFFLSDLGERPLGVQNKYNEKHIIILSRYSNSHLDVSMPLLLPKTLSLLSTFHGRWRWLRQNTAIYIYLYTVTNGVCPSLPFLSLSHDCPLGDSNDTAHPLGWLTWEISCVLHIIQGTAWLYGMPTAS